MTLGILFATLAVTGGLLWRIRLARLRDVENDRLTNEMVREIEERGWIQLDDPLDLDSIQEEEARFWEEEPWEEADEW